MSLASDRAEAIYAAIKVDTDPRAVYLMPAAAFTCRVVAVPLWAEDTMGWVERESEAFAGVISSGDAKSTIESVIWKAMKVPRGTVVSVSH